MMIGGAPLMACVFARQRMQESTMKRNQVHELAKDVLLWSLLGVLLTAILMGA